MRISAYTVFALATTCFPVFAVQSGIVISGLNIACVMMVPIAIPAASAVYCLSSDGREDDDGNGRGRMIDDMIDAVD